MLLIMFRYWMRDTFHKNTVVWIIITTIFCAACGAYALTGDGVTEETLLETISPVLESAEAVSDRTITASFSEPLLTPGALETDHYTVSGTGIGTLESSPAEVTNGPDSFSLEWVGGEMRDNSPLLLTVSGVQDIVGNPLRPDSGEVSLSGKGTAPVFSNLVVVPPEASVGDIVILTFSVSETLKAFPQVLVDGSIAIFHGEASGEYVFEYTVKRGDDPGMAEIEISGEDRAGNIGSFHDNDSLELLDSAATMPLYPVYGALALLGVVAFAGRRLFRPRFKDSHRITVIVLEVLLLEMVLCGVAVAQAPVVTNVTMSQRPDIDLGTKVDIYYDLAANAPCDVLLSLSKDGGADGYPYGLIHYTGDIADVVPGADKHIVWNIRADCPEEYLSRARIRVTANDENIEHTLTYLSGEHGLLTGPTTQTLNHGEDGETVTAVPEEGYHFTGWSDGVLTASRQDIGVVASLSVTADFVINSYAVNCVVVGNGACIADPSTVNHGSTSVITVTSDPGWYTVSIVDSEEGVKSGSYTTTPITADRTVTATFDTTLLVSSLEINAGTDIAENPLVTLDNVCTGNPEEYLASEFSNFSGALWQPYDASPVFILSKGVGPRTVYFKVRNEGGESSAISDTIFLAPEMLPVAATVFEMGRTDVGDDAFYGFDSELPVHTVALDDYAIAKFITTNKQYCDVLNWAFSHSLLKTFNGLPWTGTGDIYTGGSLEIIVAMTEPECNIHFENDSFTPRTRTGTPGETVYSMEDHPVVRASWFGAVAFCNWLSEWQGLTPCYDMGAADWPLTLPPPASGGYRLPTEAEWERAAAWSDDRHWLYGYINDTLSENRCNYGFYPYGPYVNPLGLTELPYTSPVGWFNGMNISPNGGIPTIDSPSPVGAYDMSGNVWEWCQDWYSSTYYSGGAMTNPTGPEAGATKVFRGGAFRDAQNCRSACRDSRAPDKTPYWRSFRIARTP